MRLALVLLAACGSNSPQTGVDAPQVHDGAGQPSDALASDGAAGDGASSDGSTALTDPAGPGPYTVTTATVSIPAGGTRTAPATTYVPSSAAPRPLVFVSPGFQMARTQYASYAQHLASWGFTVVLADYTDTGFFADHQQLADDIALEISWAIGQQNLGVDAAAIATAGHSLGGDLSMLVAADDNRIKAVVGWDPVDGGNPAVLPKVPSIGAAIAVIGETTDGSGGFMPCAPTASNYQKFFAGAKPPAYELNVPTADHMDWVDDPSCAACGLCTAGTASAELARTATRRLNVAWLRTRFFNDSAMAPWLAAPPEVAAGTATVATK